MITLNKQQKDFYESRFEANEQEGALDKEPAANLMTNTWTSLRRGLQHAGRAAGVQERVYELHRSWMQDLAGDSVLDLGCFDGNPLSLWIAERCASYTGVDLSAQAIEALERKLRAQGYAHAHAIAQDFLVTQFPEEHFDLVYAHSVLHHFEDLDVALAELHRILKPGGRVISVDPLMTEPLNRIARTLYRPMQSDRQWEWPFTRRTFDTIGRYFDVVDMQGLQGMVKIGYPLQTVPRLAGFGLYLSRLGQGFDNRFARRPNLPFFLCWQATLLLRKRDLSPSTPS
jgi:SAM-dependent methyltransferase